VCFSPRGRRFRRRYCFSGDTHTVQGVDWSELSLASLVCTVGLGCRQTRLRIGQVVDHEWHNWNGPMRTSHCITDNSGSTDHCTNQYDKMTLTFPRQLPKKSDQALQVHSKMDSLIRTRFLKNYPKPYRGIATVLLQPTSGTPIRVAVESRLRRSLHNRNVLRQWRAKRYWRDPI
jgi:hypothetical protein